MDRPNPYVEHTYSGEKGDKNIRFSINANTNDLTEIYISYKRDKIIEDEDMCKEVIEAFVGKYINVSDYKVYSSGGGGYNAYSHMYYRNVDGYKTSEKLEISVDADGRIYKFEAHSVGEFDNIEKVKYSEEKVKKALADKLDKIYEGDDDNWTDFEVTSVSLVKLSNRKYGFWCETRVYENDDYHLFTFLVK